MLSEICQPEKDRYHYVFSHMWILRNFTEDHGRREGRKKISYKQRERETNHKRLLNTKNKLRVVGQEVGGVMG